MSRNIILLLFLGALTLVFGADYNVSAEDLQNMSTQKRVAYINNFKKEIIHMNSERRAKALKKMRIAMNLDNLPGRSQDDIQQMQGANIEDLNLMKNMFQRQIHLKLHEGESLLNNLTNSTTDTLTNTQQPLSLPF